MFDENNNFNEEKIAEETVNNESFTEQEVKEESFKEEENFTEQENINENREYRPVYRVVLPTKEEIEKADVKRLGRAVGTAFLVFYVVMWVLNLIAILIARIFEPSFNNAVNLLSDPALMQVQQIVFSLSVFTLPFIFIFKLFKFRISDLISFKPPKGKRNFYLFLVGISFCSFANIASSLAEQIFDRAGINYEVDFGDNPEGFFGFMLSFIATAIVPALAEEFACRGIMMGALKKQGEAFAIIVSSVLFGLMHSNFEQIPFAFLVGLVLAYITVKADTIWIAVAVHCFNNSISLIYTYFLSGLSGIAQNISYTIFLIACLVAGLFAITKLGKETDIFCLAKETAVTGLSKRLKWFFLSVPIIIYASICILQSLMYFT